MASSFHARIDCECEAKQLLLKPLVVYLEKSRMCQNKYSVQCVRKSKLLCSVSHVWLLGLMHLVHVGH